MPRKKDDSYKSSLLNVVRTMQTVAMDIQTAAKEPSPAVWTILGPDLVRRINACMASVSGKHPDLFAPAGRAVGFEKGLERKLQEEQERQRSEAPDEPIKWKLKEGLLPP